MKPRPSPHRVRELLSYDPVTGVFRWKVRRNSNAPVGAIAGNISTQGYRRIGIDNRSCFAHDLAWVHVFGEWPGVELDHRNHERDDNRIRNLRPATPAQNQQNQCRAQRGSASGLLGVYPERRRWVAKIQVDGKTLRLGAYDTPDEASAAYLRAKHELHPFWDGTMRERDHATVAA